MKRNTALLPAAIVAIVLLGIGIYLLSHSPAAVTASDTVRIGGPGLEQDTLIYAAMDKGFFAANGLDVTFRETSGELK